MLRAGPQAIERLAMQRRTVPFVFREPVTRVQLVNFAHNGVPPDFRNDRCSADGRNQVVSSDNRTPLYYPAGEFETWQAVAIHLH